MNPKFRIGDPVAQPSTDRDGSIDRMVVIGHDPRRSGMYYRVAYSSQDLRYNGETHYFFEGDLFTPAAAAAEAKKLFELRKESDRNLENRDQLFKNAWKEQ